MCASRVRNGRLLLRGGPCACSAAAGCGLAANTTLARVRQACRHGHTCTRCARQCQVQRPAARLAAASDTDIQAFVDIELAFDTEVDAEVREITEQVYQQYEAAIRSYIDDELDFLSVIDAAAREIAEQVHQQYQAQRLMASLAAASDAELQVFIHHELDFELMAVVDSYAREIAEQVQVRFGTTEHVFASKRHYRAPFAPQGTFSVMLGLGQRASTPNGWIDLTAASSPEGEAFLQGVYEGGGGSMDSPLSRDGQDNLGTFCHGS